MNLLSNVFGHFFPSITCSRLLCDTMHARKTTFVVIISDRIHFIHLYHFSIVIQSICVVNTKMLHSSS